MANKPDSATVEFKLIDTRYTSISFESIIPPEQIGGGKLEINLRCNSTVLEKDPSFVMFEVDLSGTGVPDQDRQPSQDVTAFSFACKLECIFNFNRPMTPEQLDAPEIHMTNTVSPMLFDFTETVLYKMGYKGIELPRSMRLTDKHPEEVA